MQGRYDRTPKLGVALVGLGEYSTKQLGPALKATKHCYLAGVVSGDEQKRKKWQAAYNLAPGSLYSYDNFEEIENDPAIDIVYIVLPNALHAEFAIRAARAGKHVICEKPMAITVEQCQQMIDACRNNGVKLSIGYRLHFDPYNKEMMRLGQQQELGHVRNLIAYNSMEIGPPGQWRLKKALAGGGPLMNNGIYCVQAAQYIMGELPIAVKAAFLPVTDPGKFSEVEEGIWWEMEFSGRVLAHCESSYSMNDNLLRAEADYGWFELEPAYEYKGLDGFSSAGPLRFQPVNQQAAQMDDFALCIKNNRESRVPGEMGLRDVQIMQAIYESARTGKKIALQLEAFESLVEK